MLQNKKENVWEPLALAFLRSVEDSFYLNDLRDALGYMNVKAPIDGKLVNWLRDRGWDNKRNTAYANVMWHRQVGCLDTPKTATLKS